MALLVQATDVSEKYLSYVSTIHAKQNHRSSPEALL